MKKILTSSVTSTSRQPLLGRSISHLQEGLQENDNSLIRALLPTYTAGDIVVIYGCLNSGVNSGAGLAYNVSAGAVYYNGEIYQVAAASGVITGTNVVLLTLTTSYQSGDPVTNTDGSLNNVHQINTMVVSEAASGSGTKDFSALKTIVSHRSVLSATAASQTISSAAPTWADLTSVTVTTPNDNRVRMYAIFFKARIDEDNGNATAFVEFQLLQGSTQLDETSVGKSLATATDVFLIPVNLVYVGLIDPNTIIKVQARRTTANCTAYTMKLYAVEIF